MTTTVTIAHQGPAGNVVTVDVVNVLTENVMQTRTLVDGEAVTLFVFDGQGINIRESKD